MRFTRYLLQNVLSVTLQLSWELQTRQMCLDQQIRLVVGVIEFRPHQFEGDPRGQLLQERVLLVADGEVLVLSSR